MATITATSTYDGSHTIWTWTPVTESDTCAGVNVEGNVSDLFLQVSGTFGSSSTAIQGSVDNTTYSGSLVNPAGDAIAITAAGGSAVRDAPPYLKPVPSGGSSQSITIKLSARIVR